MSCGLGAVILIFMLVKHNVENAVIETELLQADLVRLQLEEQSLRQDISDIQIRIDGTDNDVRTASSEISALQAQISQTKKLIDENKSQVSSLEKTIENTEPVQKSDVIEKDVSGEQNYVMGLKVEGRKIAILLDASASMTDETLIEVIRRKNNTDAAKRKGPKWIRTQAIVQWLLARLPKRSEVAVVAFNGKSKVLGGKGWASASSANSLSSILKDLGALTPTGPTNLQEGLKKVRSMRPSNIYLITDGLPTDGNSNYRSLNPFADCSSLLSNATTISGECRVKLFRQSVIESAPGPNVVLNVILLPFEGDPQAAPEMWSWASATGGLLLSPAESWP